MKNMLSYLNVTVVHYITN